MVPRPHLYSARSCGTRDFRSARRTCRGSRARHCRRRGWCHGPGSRQWSFVRSLFETRRRLGSRLRRRRRRLGCWDARRPHARMHTARHRSRRCRSTWGCNLRVRHWLRRGRGRVMHGSTRRRLDFVQRTRERMRALVRFNQPASFFHGIDVMRGLRMIRRRCGSGRGCRDSGDRTFRRRFFSICEGTEVFAHFFGDIVLEGA
jgi:hypothetical protein